MRVMTRSAVENDALTSPVGSPFAVSSPDPVPLLTKVTLTAQLITVVEVDFLPLFVFKIIPFLRMVAIYAGKCLSFTSVF